MIIHVSLSTSHVRTRGSKQLANNFDLYIPDSIGCFYDYEGKAVPIIEALTRYIEKFPTRYCF